MTKPVTPGGAERAATVTSSTDFLDGYISEEEYAARRNVSLRTCQRDRHRRNAPPYVRIGKKVYYRIESIRHWLAQREASADRKPVAPRTRRARL